MPHPRRDQNRSSGSKGVRLAVEFDRGVLLAFQDDIDLRVLLVVMASGIAGNVREMNGSREFLSLSESSSRGPTGAGNRGK